MVTYDSELLQQYGKTVGTFEGTTPNLVTIDTDLIRAVFVDDFDHFVTRRVRDMVVGSRLSRVGRR